MVYILSIEIVGLGSLIIIVGWIGLRMGDWLVGGVECWKYRPTGRE